MLKNDRWIKTFGESGGISPYNPDHVNPASYDISLGKEVKLNGLHFDLSVSSIELLPSEKALVVTDEHIKTPNDVAITVRLKSSLARQMIISPMGLFIDPGFEGNITFCLINMGTESYQLKLGRRVGQFIFQGLNEPAEIPYGDPRRISHYQNSKGLTENKSTL